MGNFKKLAQKRLFLPVFSMILVMLINVVYDIATGSAPLSFFMISIKNGVLYGRLIDILNRGSEIAILAIGMTLVVSASGGTDISVGSVMSLYAGVCCMILAGYGNVNVQEYAHPLLVGIFLYIYISVVGLLLCNSQIVYVRVPSFQKLGAYCGIIPTPIIVAAVCVAIASIVLRYTALGTYIQSVGINKKASRIAGFNSAKIILMCYAICGLCAGLAGMVATSRIYSADTNNIGLNMELDAILSVALGGNSLGGGKFSLAGSIIGAYTIQAITTTLYALGVSSAQAPVFKAIVVIIIVVIQAEPAKAFFKKLTKKSGKEAARA